MTIKEAISLARKMHVENVQPEGAAVVNAYKAGNLQDATENLYLIAFLLHEVNKTKEPQ